MTLKEKKQGWGGAGSLVPRDAGILVTPGAQEGEVVSIAPAEEFRTSLGRGEDFDQQVGGNVQEEEEVAELESEEQQCHLCSWN